MNQSIYTLISRINCNNKYITIITLFIISCQINYCQVIHMVQYYAIYTELTLFIISGSHIHPVCLTSNMGVSFVVCKVSNTLRTTKMLRTSDTFQLFRKVKKSFMILTIAKRFGVNVRHILVQENCNFTRCWL